MYQDVQITDYLEIVYQKLAKGGVFLTAQNQSSLNTMTIGWEASLIFGQSRSSSYR